MKATINSSLTSWFKYLKSEVLRGFHDIKMQLKIILLETEIFCFN